MTEDILKSLLHDTEDASTHLVGKRIGHIFGSHVHLDAAAAGDFARLPLQRRYQTQIVQHGRPQQQSDIANRVHARIGELSNVVQVVKTNGVIRLDPFPEIGRLY